MPYQNRSPLEDQLPVNERLPPPRSNRIDETKMAPLYAPYIATQGRTALQSLQYASIQAVGHFACEGTATSLSRARACTAAIGNPLSGPFSEIRLKDAT